MKQHRSAHSLLDRVNKTRQISHFGMYLDSLVSMYTPSRPPVCTSRTDEVSINPQTVSTVNTTRHTQHTTTYRVCSLVVANPVYCPSETPRRPQAAG
jgi:hypothetical protein